MGTPNGMVTIHRGGNSADVMARQQGFPDAATTLAFFQHRSDALRNGQGAATVQPGNDGGSILNPIQNGKYQGPLGGIFNHIAAALGRAAS